MPEKILIIEDDDSLATLTRLQLESKSLSGADCSQRR